MAYGTPTDPVAGTVITVAWAVSNVLDPIRALRANTGATDPPAINRIAVSTGVGGPSTWQQVPTDAIADGSVTDAKMLNQKVNRVPPTASSFAAASVLNSGFLNVSNAGAAIVDAPTSATDWHLIQVRHPNVGVDFRWQRAIAIGDQNEVYERLVIGGAAGTWRRAFNAGNLDPVLRSGSVMTGALTIAGTATVTANPGSAPAGGVIAVHEVAASGGSWVLEPITNAFVIARVGAASFFQLAANGAISTISAAFTGAVSAASATISGAISAASATISDITATNVVASNIVQALRLVSTVATGTAPLQVNSTTQVNNLNAQYHGGNLPAAYAAAGHAHAYGNASAVTTIYAGNSSGSPRAIALGVGWTPLFAVIQVVAGAGPQAVFLMNHDGVAVVPGTPGSVAPAQTGFSFSAGTVTVPSSSWNLTGLSYRVTAIGA